MRKKLFAILMSAMMMVTFMPAMAFADPAPVVPGGTPELTETFYVTSWNDYTTVTGYYYKTGETKKTVITVPTTRALDDDGSIVATPNATYMQKYGITDYSVSANYYDFDCLKMNYSVMTYSEFAGLFINPANGAIDTNVVDNTLTFTATAPAYDTTTEVGDRVNTNVSLPLTSVKLNVTGYDVTTPYVQQSVTITATPSSKNAFLARDYFGSIAPATVVVLPDTAEASDVFFYVDSVKANNFITSGDAGHKHVGYNGANHTIVTNEVPGFEVSYKQVNAATGKYEAVTAPSFKDAGLYQIIAEVKNAAKVVERTVYLTVKVYDADIMVDFVPVEGLVYDGEVTNAWDYLVITTDPDDKASKAALEADKAALEEMVKEMLKLTVTDKPYTTDKKLSVELALDSEAAFETFETKYATLLNNYDVEVVGDDWDDFDGDYATLTQVSNTKVNELDFLGNSTMTKTVHVKNAKAVKKTAYRNVKAESLSGVAPTFKKISGNSKITVAADGKMTIKKGLKKGTYKVKVKATVAAGKGYARITATKTYTVKVVK